MPFCFRCAKEIDSLNWTSSRTESWGGSCELDSSNDSYFSASNHLTRRIEYSREWDSSDYDDTGAPTKTEYYCPECNALLFTKEIDAIGFLRGGDDNGQNERIGSTTNESQSVQHRKLKKTIRGTNKPKKKSVCGKRVNRHKKVKS